MAKADECLFLLEVLIDKIIFIKSPCFSDNNFKTCVSFEFLSLAPLEICDDDKGTCSASSGGPYIKEFNTGKSCLFALKQPDIDKAMSGFPIKVTVFKALPCDCLPTKFIMGTSTIEMTKQFSEARKKFLAEPENVSYESLKDSFRLVATDNSETGDLMLFLRISCFGNIIITKFQGGGGCPVGGGSQSMQGSSKKCSPKKAYRSMDDPCYCGSKSGGGGPVRGGMIGGGGGGGGGGCDSSVVCPTDASLPCADADDPCYCTGKGPASPLASVGCRNTEAYCLHVPKGGGPTHYEEMGTSLNGNDLKIKAPKEACLIKKISQTHTSLQRPYGKSGNCEPPCAINQIALNLPVNSMGIGGIRQQATQFTCTTEGCNMAGKHGTGGCNIVPKNVPGAKATTTKLHPNKDVFVLRVAKTASDGDKKTKLELELVTPKGPDKKLPVRMETRDSQCEDENSGKKKGGAGGKKKKGVCEF